MIFPEKGTTRNRVENWFKRKKATPNIIAQVSGNETIASMVSLGFGVGVVSPLVISSSPVKCKIQTLSIQPKLDPLVVGVCVQKSRLKTNALMTAFWELISNQVSEG